MFIDSKIILSLDKPNGNAVVHAIQDDGNTRRVVCRLLSDGDPWVMPEDVSAAVTYTDSAGNKGLFDMLPDGSPAIVVEGNIATVTLPRPMLQTAGTVYAAVIFDDAQLNRLTTFPFVVKVSSNPFAGSQPVEDYIRIKWIEDELDKYMDAAIAEVEKHKDEVIRITGEFTELVNSSTDTVVKMGTAVVGAKNEAVSARDSSISAKDESVSAMNAAQGYKNQAADSESAALRYKNDAAQSESNALAYKNAAGQHASTAESHKNTASQYANNAEASKNAAAGSATEAARQASLAERNSEVAKRELVTVRGDETEVTMISYGLGDGEIEIPEMSDVNALRDEIERLENYVIGSNTEMTWKELSVAAENKLAEKMVAVGDMIADKWTDVAASREYDIDWHVCDFQDAVLENDETVHAMQLQWHWATPFGVQFSHPRAFLACPDGLAAGTYYFTIDTKWGNNCVAGDIVCFTITKAVPAGGRIAGCYYAPDQVKSNWRIYVYDAAGRSVLETVTPTFEAAGTNLGTQRHNSRNGLLNSTQEMAFGWNRWKTSAVRQYLNSDEAAGQWWTAQDQWDIAPDQLGSKAGFLSGVPQELRDVMKVTKVVTYPNTVNDDPGGNTPDITYDKVFLPSLGQMFIQEQKAGEGDAWAYWKKVRGQDSRWAHWNTYPELKHFGVENKSAAQTVRLRSANRGYAHSTWNVISSGSISSSYAYYANRFAPACII